MHLVVHFGMYKTGSTAIQQVFFRNQAAFLEQGVLYPKMPPVPAHHLVIAQFDGKLPPNLPRYFGGDPARLRQSARAAWEQLVRDIDRHKPAKVVLSSEMFLFSQTSDGHRRFRALLDTLGGPVEAWCYVRAPAPYYLSFLQQRSKVSGEVLAPEPLQIRRRIEDLEAAFGQPMRLRAYDPARFVDGDVVGDFAQAVVGCPIPDGVNRGQRFNETLSAEAMSISVSNRRANCQGRDELLDREHRLILNMLKDLEKQVGGSVKPRLKPEVAAAVTRASVDLLWLREARGIEFGDIDYDMVDGHMPEQVVARREIDAICDVDPARRDLMMMHLLHDGAEARLSLGQIERSLPVGAMMKARAWVRDTVSGLTRWRRG